MELYESDYERRQFIMENKRTNIVIQALFTFMCQLIPVILILLDITSDYFKDYELIGKYNEEIVKFICTTILHLHLLGELTAALERMKFVLNHGHKFSSPNFAFVNTVTQSFAILIVEVCSLLVILSSTDVLQIVMNFIALAIIADFDNYMY